MPRIGATPSVSKRNGDNMANGYKRTKTGNYLILIPGGGQGDNVPRAQLKIVSQDETIDNGIKAIQYRDGSKRSYFETLRERGVHGVSLGMILNWFSKLNNEAS